MCSHSIPQKQAVNIIQYQLEQRSPQIIGHDAEAWLNFLKRDVPNYKTKRHQPSDPRNWHKVYKKLKKDAEEELSKGEDELKAAFAGIKAEKEKNTSQFVSQQDVGNIRGNAHMLFNNGRWNAKSTKSMTLMDKAKKEARDAAAAKANFRPTTQFPQRTTAVRQAPQRFIDQARRHATSPEPQAQPIIRAPRTSRPPLHAPPRPRGPAVEAEYDIMKDREARLQAMKGLEMTNGPASTQTAGKSSSPSSTVEPTSERPGSLSSRYLEDDLFDEDDGADDHRTLLKPPEERPRSASPGRMSPKPVLKRKAQAPSLFMSPSKKPFLKRPGVT